jgi:hypothetical protein
MLENFHKDVMALDNKFLTFSYNAQQAANKLRILFCKLFYRNFALNCNVIIKQYNSTSTNT